MAVSGLAEVVNQVQKYWAPTFTKQLRAKLLLGSLVNKQYQGEIKKGGDRVRVSQVNAPAGQNLTVGVDADSFDTAALSTSYIDITADRRAVAAYEFEDLVDLQSQLSLDNPEVRDSLLYAMSEQINNHLYGKVAPSSSAPDHVINGIADFNATRLADCRLLAAQAKWAREPGWYALVDPSYYTDLMNALTLVSSDYGASDAPTIGGQIALKRFGFNIFEDDSRSADQALLFHPDFLHLVMQQEVRVKISDMHAQKKFGMVMSVDVVYGAALGIDGAKKHITVKAAASG